MTQPPGLGPHCVGSRVVVRRVLRGQTGPSGGPAMTDLLGVMESWDGTDHGGAGRGRHRSPRSRSPTSSPASRCRRGHRCGSASAPSRPAGCRTRRGPPVHARPLGDWLLRASGGFSARANSVMAIGDPGVPFEEAVATTARVLPRARPDPVGPGGGRAPRPEIGSSRRGGRWPGRARPTPSSRSRPWRRRRAPCAACCPPRRPRSRWVRRSPPPGWPTTSARSPTTTRPSPCSRGPTRWASSRSGRRAPARRSRSSPRDGSPSRATGPGITDVWVAPEHRRRGLGVVVLDAMIAGLPSAAPPRRTCKFAQTTHLRSRSTPHWDFAPTTATATSRRPTSPRRRPDMRARLVLMLVALAGSMLVVTPTASAGPSRLPLRGHRLPQELRQRVPLEPDVGRLQGQRRPPHDASQHKQLAGRVGLQPPLDELVPSQQRLAAQRDLPAAAVRRLPRQQDQGPRDLPRPAPLQATARCAPTCSSTPSRARAATSAATARATSCAGGSTPPSTTTGRYGCIKLSPGDLEQLYDAWRSFTKSPLHLQGARPRGMTELGITR